MSTNVILNGTTFSIPASGERNWASLSSYLIALSTGVLTKAGGSFTLTAEVNFGATYGLKSAYYKSQGTNVAAAGILRLANAESVSWRNNANGADVALTVNASDRLQIGGVNVPSISSTDTLTNKTIVAASNTITTAATGNLAATELNAALAELQGDIDTRATVAGAENITGAKTFTDHVAVDNAKSVKFYETDANGSHFIGLKAPNSVAADKTFVLPDGDGSANQVLKTDGSGNLGWVSPLTNPMTADQDLIVGTSGGTASRLPTSLLGDILADLNSTTVTMTIATPCVVTHTSHGLNTGDKIYLTTDGALPTGLSASTTYYIVKVDANSYNLASSLSNALAGTKIDTSGSQSGTHTAYSGGLTYPNGIRGNFTGTAVPSGYIGQTITVASSGGVTPTSGQYTDGGNAGITPGKGTWVFAITVAVTVGTMSNLNLQIYGLGTAPGNDGTGLGGGATDLPTVREAPAAHTPSGNMIKTLTTHPILVTSDSQTYYPKFYCVATVGAASVACHIKATRIA